MNDFGYDTEQDVEVLSGCFMMARRDASKKLACSTRDFLSTRKMWTGANALGRGWGVRFYPEARAIHYGGASSAVAPAKFLIEMEKANLQYWRKHHTWLGQTVAMTAILAHYWTRMCGWLLIYLVRPGREPQAQADDAEICRMPSLAPRSRTQRCIRSAVDLYC